MVRKRVLQILLGIVGALFSLGTLTLLKWSDPEMIWMQMLASVYATLGIMLLLAIRNPSAHRSLIAFTAWSSLAHGGVMAVQVTKNLIPKADWLRAVLPLCVIGVLLIVLAPRTDSGEEDRATKNQSLRSAPTITPQL